MNGSQIIRQFKEAKFAELTKKHSLYRLIAILLCISTIMNPDKYKSNERDSIILPTDGLIREEAWALADEFSDDIWGVKMHDLLDRHGADVIPTFKEKKLRVMADPKLHDIPETVRKRGLIYAEAGADYLTVHGSGDVDMMRMLGDAIHESPDLWTKVIAISVLTSLTPEQCQKIYGALPPEKVKELALMAAEAGVDGLVCSPQEVAIVNSSRFTAPLIKITPGIRMPDGKVQDQKRVADPYSAIKGGANQLVVGRPILEPEKGMTGRQALEMFVEEIKRAWGEIKQEESEKFLKEFAKVKALWLDREMISPVHAKLASGLHSNAFFNATKVIQNPRLLEAAVKSRSLNLKKYGKVDWVVGSAMGGVTIAHEVAKEVGAKCAYTEKLELLDARDRIPLVNFLIEVNGGSDVTEIPQEIVQILEKLGKINDLEKMALKRFDDIQPGDTVLVCEDTITTGGTTAATIRALAEKGCKVIREIVALCDRTDGNQENFALADYSINSLIQLQLPVHPPDNCPMCIKGSVADSVKKRWAELIQS